MIVLVSNSGSFTLPKAAWPKETFERNVSLAQGPFSEDTAVLGDGQRVVKLVEIQGRVSTRDAVETLSRLEAILAGLTEIQVYLGGIKYRREVHGGHLLQAEFGRGTLAVRIAVSPQFAQWLNPSSQYVTLPTGVR